MSTVRYIPDSATGYRVEWESRDIGRVERVGQDWRSRRPPTWSYSAPNGAYGQVGSRTKATETLLYFAKQAGVVL